jgi:hypothetical protein
MAIVSSREKELEMLFMREASRELMSSLKDSV